MASSKDIAAGLLNFSHAEYSAFDQVDVTNREVMLLDSDFTGIAINAPCQISVTQQPSLPIAVATRLDGARSWDVPLGQNCFLAATNLVDGSVQFAPCFPSQKELESRGGPDQESAPQRPTPEELEGEGAQISWTEATGRLDIPWQTGGWAFGAIYFDWVSNVVTTQLTGGGPPPAVADREIFPKPAESSGFPTFMRRASTPKASTQGAGFLVKLVPGEEGAQKLYVTGAFTVPMRSFSVVKKFSVLDGGQEKFVHAVVPVTFVVLGLNWKQPWWFNWSVPIYGQGEIGHAVVEGCFTLDAFDNAGVPELQPGSYVSYLIIDGLIYGPLVITVPEP